MNLEQLKEINELVELNTSLKLFMSFINDLDVFALTLANGDIRIDVSKLSLKHQETLIKNISDTLTDIRIDVLEELKKLGFNEA